jgi:hypothetical protein
MQAFFGDVTNVWARNALRIDRQRSFALWRELQSQQHQGMWVYAYLNEQGEPLTRFGRIAETRSEARHTRFNPILFAKLVESRTPKQTTVFADSLPARETPTY